MGERGVGGGVRLRIILHGEIEKRFPFHSESRHTTKTTIFDFLSFIYIFWINMNYNLIILFTVPLKLKDHQALQFYDIKNNYISFKL